MSPTALAPPVALPFAFQVLDELPPCEPAPQRPQASAGVHYEVVGLLRERDLVVRPYPERLAQLLRDDHLALGSHL